ncbi:hypothetical protein SERLA73DRAFT_175284 [Serpula lacrymans var. lacrymans S7.3]|uniref:Uncharacterized protein n=2 Tax=Serpula lacrymans var. lacrymans TaxID=341189 RepID=F8PIQ8_SERL3|nr:hypothetical protein SERLA73DRAFT_175284 [Serpula lacrymans var. lacrymans S7.3]
MWTSRRNWNHHETIDEHSSFDPSGSMDAVSVMQFAQASFLNAPYSSPETVELPIVDGSSGSTFGEKSGNDDFSHPASR